MTWDNDEIVIRTKISAIRAILLQYGEDKTAYFVSFLLPKEVSYPDPGEPFNEELVRHTVILRPGNKTNPPNIGPRTMSATLSFNRRIHHVEIDYLDIISIIPENGAPMMFTYILRDQDPGGIIPNPEVRRKLRVVN